MKGTDCLDMNILGVEEYRRRRTGDPAVIITDKKKFYEGTIWPVMVNNRLAYVKIINYADAHNITVEFLDDTHYQTKTRLDKLSQGISTYSPYIAGKYGEYIGEGKFGEGKSAREYSIWMGIIRRSSDQHAGTNGHIYSNTTICPDWLNFQNFAQWFTDYEAKLNPKYHLEYEVDKDILQWNQPFKIYSPEVCCLVPHAVNAGLNKLHWKVQFHGDNLPIGVSVVERNMDVPKYRTATYINGHQKHLGHFDTPEEAFQAYSKARKAHIVEIATLYYQEGAILPDIYERLCNLEILPYN